MVFMLMEQTSRKLLRAGICMSPMLNLGCVLGGESENGLVIPDHMYSSPPEKTTTSTATKNKQTKTKTDIRKRTTLRMKRQDGGTPIFFLP